jgi:hypothetical protein
MLKFIEVVSSATSLAMSMDVVIACLMMFSTWISNVITIILF